MTKEEKKLVTFTMSKSAYKRLAIYAIMEETSLSKVVAEAVTAYISKKKI